MSIISTICPTCRRRLALSPGEILLWAPAEPGHAEPRDEGCFGFVCRHCCELVVKTADAPAVGLLLTGGVDAVGSRAAAAQDHPEAPADGLPLTADDLLTLHLMLASDDWFDRLLATRGTR